MSHLVSRALVRNFCLGSSVLPIDSARHRLEVAAGLLQYALAPLGCRLWGWYAEMLFHEAWDIQQHFEHEMPKKRDFCDQPWGQLLDASGPVVAHLAEGLRDQRSEYRLVALLYDLWGGVQDMHTLQTRMDSVFTWIALDAALRKIGNDNGFKLS